MGKRYRSSEITRRAISSALKGLMAQKPLERITVAEIMDACGMRRQHFYYYFTDIYDLVRWTFENEALELIRRQGEAQAWEDGLLQLFRYIADNRAVCLCALDSLGREALKQLFERDIDGIVRSTVKQTVQENRFPEDTEKQELAARFLTMATAGIVENWLRGELSQTPEELIQVFSTMLQDYTCGLALRLRRGPSQVQRK